MPDNTENRITSTVSKFINNTNRTIFLTGKAGTGKTTFLKSIIYSTHKNVIVAAPTGIAAINAGGVTLHSLFQLPFGAFLPQNVFFENSNITTQLNTPKSLLSSFQMNKTKRNMLRELELLIIDEVSMLRADLLDAIDLILRHVRRNKSIPFGGVQVLFIGDLLQLPPVVKDEEWRYLSSHYSGMYFFNALVLQNNKPLYVELDKIYRQTDNRFIQLLNNLRDNHISQEDIQLLNQHFDPDFEQKNEDGYILLTTHNRFADEKNLSALKNIKEPSYYFNAEIEGDFSEYNYPVDNKLELKSGAQVMFIKNDYSGEQRYFNGKIGFISEISQEEIIVSFNDGSEPALVEPYTWENKKYTLNKETNEIEENVVGKFIHYPLKLAWAITIHKSQGLTFDKAIIDVGRAFAPGQIYVALSRLTSLDGLILTSKIPTSGLSPDKSLGEFARNRMKESHLESQLESDSRAYFNYFILHAFDLTRLVQELSYHVSSYSKDEKRSIKQQYKSWATDLLEDTKPIKKVADNFRAQVNNIITSNAGFLPQLHERIVAAIGYFEPLLQKLSDRIFDKMNDLQGQKGIKKYMTELKELDTLFYRQLQVIYKAESLIDVALRNTEFSKSEVKEPAVAKERKEKAEKAKTKAKPTKKRKEKKEDTKLTSYKLFKEGKSIKQIALERTLVPGTVEGHLAHYVREGLIDVKELIDKEKYKKIASLADELDTLNLGQLKAELSNDFSYGEIRMAVSGIMAERDKEE